MVLTERVLRWFQELFPADKALSHTPVGAADLTSPAPRKTLQTSLSSSNGTAERTERGQRQSTAEERLERGELDAGLEEGKQLLERMPAEEAGSVLDAVVQSE
eukprot:1769661-Rhodomonas_salina.1